MIIFSGYGLKIFKEVYLVTAQTEDDKSKEAKRGDELFFVHMETWLVFGSILFQMRKLNYNENLIQFPVERGMTGPSLWTEKSRSRVMIPVMSSLSVRPTEVPWDACASLSPSLSHGIHVSEPGVTLENTLSTLLIYRVVKWIAPLCSWYVE